MRDELRAPAATSTRAALSYLFSILVLILSCGVVGYQIGIRAGEDRVMDVVCAQVDQAWSRHALDCMAEEE